MTVLLGVQDVAEAARLLLAGQLVAFGTETVYGLGADATQSAAVAQVFDAKGRPHFNPLICHYPDADAAFSHVSPNDAARLLAAAFWPGPLTLVLPRRITCPVALLAGAGLETLAVRVPAHAGALDLLRAVGRPVAAPSANRSGQVSPTTPEHVLAGLAGRIAAVLDGGACPVGVESTVLDLSAGAPCLLRPGGIGIEAIEAVIGPVGRGITPAAAEKTRNLRSPGLLVSHYAPALPVWLDRAAAEPNEALLAFGPAPRGAGATFQLSEEGDVVEAASRLFGGLRWLDAEGARLGLRGIAAMPVPDTGLGLAINDRLQRAAAPPVRIGTDPQWALAWSFFRFGVVGTTGFLVDTTVVYSLKGLVGLYAAGMCSFFVAASWTWAFNRWWTFAGKGSGPMWRQWLHFLFVNLSGLVLNRGAYFMLITASPLCRENPILAVAAGAVAGMFANFFAVTRLVFR